MIQEELRALIPQLVKMSARLERGDFDPKALAHELDTAVSMLGLALAIEWKLCLFIRGEQVELLEYEEFQRRAAAQAKGRAASGQPAKAKKAA